MSQKKDCRGQNEEEEEEVDYAEELDILAGVTDKDLRDRRTNALMVKAVSEVASLREGILLLELNCEKIEAEKVALMERCRYLKTQCLAEI